MIGFQYKSAAAILFALAVVVPLVANASQMDLTCTHVTKSTLKQAPLVRPLFEPQDTAKVSVLGASEAEIRLATTIVPAAIRTCPKGGTWTRHCPQARALDGDVLSFYEDVSAAQPPIFAIWGRKGVKKTDLVENVVLRCCYEGQTC